MKTFKNLAAITLAALGLSVGAAIFASPAQAQIDIPTCTDYTVQGTAWPGGVYTQYCGDTTHPGSPNDAQYLYTALLGFNGSSGQAALKNAMTTAHTTQAPYNGVFYVFYDAAQFQIWAAANLPTRETPNPSVYAGVKGFTWTDRVFARSCVLNK